MLERLMEKRAECLNEIEDCKFELERATLKLELIEELIAEEQENTKADEEETAANSVLM